MYDRDDPRACLPGARPGGAPAAPVTAYAGAEYARFYEMAPQEGSPQVRTWYARGQNFLVVYTEAQEGAVLSRSAQPDEYVVLLPQRSTAIEVTTPQGTTPVAGFSLVIVPPGESSIRVRAGGPIYRLVSTRSVDLAALCCNAASYATPHPNVAPLVPWPAPPDGYRVRAYSLDVPEAPGRFGGSGGARP